MVINWLAKRGASIANTGSRKIGRWQLVGGKLVGGKLVGGKLIGGKTDRRKIGRQVQKIAQDAPFADDIPLFTDYIPVDGTLRYPLHWSVLREENGRFALVVELDWSGPHWKIKPIDETQRAHYVSHKVRIPFEAACGKICLFMWHAVN